MKMRTFAIGSILGILLLSLLAACGSELERDGAGVVPQSADSQDLSGGQSPYAAGDEAETAFQALAAPDSGTQRNFVGGGSPDSASVQTGAGAGGTSGGETGPDLQGLLDRKIIRTATLNITVEDVAGGMQEVERIANTAGGFVSGSSLSVINPQNDDEERRQTGTITIRVPSEAYASVMNQLRGIATEVDAESSDTSEVTAEYTDLKSRLRTLEVTEGRYLELLTRAETIPDILTMEDRLNSVRSQIEQVLGRLNLLDDLTDLSTITVRLDLPPLTIEAPVTTEGNGWAQNAWDTSWAASEDALEVVGTIGIAASVMLLWLAIPGAIALAAWRVIARRRPDKGTIQH